MGEEAIFLERGDIDLGERGKLLARELALLFCFDALGGEHGEHVVEGPGVPHTGHRPVGRIDEIAFHRDPDVRMGACGRAARHQDCKCRQRGK
jgi:hypothetical protein